MLDPIAADFDLPVTAVEARLSAETVDNSGVVQLQFADPSPAMALEVLRALTARYLAELSAFDKAAPTLRWEKALSPAMN